MNLKSFDYFRYNLNFKYKGKSGLKTYIGAILSILIYIFVGFILVDYLLKWWYKSDYRYSFYKTTMNGNSSSHHNISLSEIPLFFYFTFYDKDHEIITSSTENILDYDFFVKGPTQMLKNEDFLLKRCSNTNLSQYKVNKNVLRYIKDSLLGEALCIDNIYSKDILFYNGDKDERSFQLNFYFNETNQLINSIYYVETDIIYISDPFVIRNHKIFENNRALKMVTLYNENAFLNTSYSKRQNGYSNLIKIKYSKTQYESKDDLFIEKGNISYFFNSDVVTDYDLYRKDTIFALQMTLSPELEILQYRNEKILDVFSRIGGIVKFIGYFTKFITFIYKKILIKSIVQDIKEYDDDKEFFGTSFFQNNLKKESINENDNYDFNNKSLLIINKSNSNKSLENSNLFKQDKLIATEKTSSNKQKHCKCCLCCCNITKSENDKDFKIYKRKIYEILDIRNVLKSLFYINLLRENFENKLYDSFKEKEGKDKFKNFQEDMKESKNSIRSQSLSLNYEIKIKPN